MLQRERPSKEKFVQRYSESRYCFSSKLRLITEIELKEKQNKAK